MAIPNTTLLHKASLALIANTSGVGIAGAATLADRDLAMRQYQGGKVLRKSYRRHRTS
jgi:hypothetical protein